MRNLVFVFYFLQQGTVGVERVGMKVLCQVSIFIIGDGRGAGILDGGDCGDLGDR